MTQPSPIEILIEQINGGRAAEALPVLDGLLLQHPGHPAVFALRAEALRVLERVPEAIEAYRLAAEHGAGSRNWLLAGMLLAAERKTDEALRCLHQALTQAPDDEQVLDCLITTYFNANRQREAIDYARRQLQTSSNPALLAKAALLLQTTDFYEESCNAFKKILQIAPDDPALVGAALGPARFTCEWEWIEALQQRIGAYYDAGNFAAPKEFPLTHITWCADEARNLGVTRAYSGHPVAGIEPLAKVGQHQPGRRLRVGYLSCDFRNHATMHLMAGVFEHHDRERFEVFAYDYSTHDISDYRQRFLDAVEHHVEIHSLSDKQAAARIAQDELDILLDLKLYTGGGRVGILPYRPASLQAAYLGYPGSAATPYIDYIVSDRFVTPDSSTPYYTEKFCRLPHTYQCNDDTRLTASAPGTRAMHGLPDDKIVFGAFNQSYKIDRGSFSVWLRILQEVPESVLWLLGQNQTAIAHLTRHAEAAGIGSDRLIFAPFAEPRQHLARLQLADAILDALVCNGHTTTSDALWAGVPVITARGRHFASRVSESLLNALEVPELVGADHDDMVRIAKRIGTDAQYRAAIRGKVAGNRQTAPLFDTARFTRNFETALEMMVRSGPAHQHIDVPDVGPVVRRAAATGTPAAAPLQSSFPDCPLCEAASVTLGFANCAIHALWHDRLPRTIEWMRCASCGHVYSRTYWTEAGRVEVQRNAKVDPAAAAVAEWTPVVERVVRLLGGYKAVADRETRPIWVDVGCGDGALLMAGADYGFAAVGLDPQGDAVRRIQGLGIQAITALQHDFLTLKFEITLDVLSMMGVLEQIPYPREALRKAAQVLRSGGVLVIGTADLTSSSWKILDNASTNPYWSDLARHHQFGRDRLIALLRESGFEVADFTLPGREKADMELYAVRK